MYGCSDTRRAQRGGSTIRGAQRGTTLIELIVAVVLAGVLLGGVWQGWTLLSRYSADPLVARQQLAVAQSLLREIELQPQPGEATAAPTPGRTGYASITDYNGLTMSGIQDAEGQAIAGLEGYGASISVVATAFEGISASEGWWINVAVTGPHGEALQLAQWRAKR